MPLQMSFWKALDLVLEWKSIMSLSWNGLWKQTMCIKNQTPTDKSKMTKSYLYMEIWEETTTEKTLVPRTPSQKDLRSNDWIVI